MTKLLRIEVCGSTVSVEGEHAGSVRPLGVFPGGLAELGNVFSRFGEPHETQQFDGRYVMIWRLDPTVVIAERPTNEGFAEGSGFLKPLPDHLKR